MIVRGKRIVKLFQILLISTTNISMNKSTNNRVSMRIDKLYYIPSNCSVLLLYYLYTDRSEIQCISYRISVIIILFPSVGKDPTFYMQMFRRTNIIASSTETESAGNNEMCSLVTKEDCNCYAPHLRE